MTEETLWVEKYRPETIEDCIAPQKSKRFFLNVVKEGEVPNLLLHGSAGTGKTTIAKALCKQMRLNYLFINASDESGIDTIRHKIKSFASTISLTGNVKVVILDEADYLNPNSAQPALRAFIEEFSKNCRFILTCNYPNRLIEPLRSRLTQVDFAIAKEEKPKMMASTMKRMKHILDTESIQYDDKIIAEVIKKNFPDNRQTIIQLQQYGIANAGVIDEGVLLNTNTLDIDEVAKLMAKKEYNKVRQWVVDHVENDPATLYKQLYSGLYGRLKPDTIPAAVVIIADYQYKAAFVVDQEVNLLACLTELMMQCEFK